MERAASAQPATRPENDDATLRPPLDGTAGTRFRPRTHREAEQGYERLTRSGLTSQGADQAVLHVVVC